MKAVKNLKSYVTVLISDFVLSNLYRLYLICIICLAKSRTSKIFMFAILLLFNFIQIFVMIKII